MDSKPVQVAVVCKVDAGPPVGKHARGGEQLASRGGQHLQPKAVR